MSLGLLLCLSAALFICIAVVSCLLSSFFVLPNRYSKALSLYVEAVLDISAVNGGYSFLFGVLVSTIIVINVMGNIPGFSIPTLFYFYTSTISLVFWVALMGVIVMSQFKSFMAHILPYGAPTGLILLLPLIEIFSNVIRPFTLMVRLSTNLSAGHIIIYMFSFFSVSSLVLSISISLVLALLFLLELIISCLQAYIFSSLIMLYLSESL